MLGKNKRGTTAVFWELAIDNRNSMFHYISNVIRYIRGDNLSYSSEILRGNTDTIILGILREKNSYGYEIMKNIIKRGNGLVDIKDATIYTAFKRMEKEELITSYWGDEDDGARRKYYSVTSKGRELYLQKVKEWKEINMVLNNLIGGDSL